MSHGSQRFGVCFCLGTELEKSISYKLWSEYQGLQRDAGKLSAECFSGCYVRATSRSDRYHKDDIE